MLFKFSTLSFVASTILAVLPIVASEFPHGYQGPKSVDQFRNWHPYNHPAPNFRKKVYIRASRSETDDISADFYAGLKKANHGGTLVLPANKTFVIGKKLDLTFLDDVEVQLDGKILFTNNITYWQNNYFYHPFQKSITFWKWGGKDIKIFGRGILDGNGQAWYDGFAGLEVLDPNNTYYRPILFYAENATNLWIEGIRFQGSPIWTNFIVTSKNVTYDNVIIENLSTNENLPKNTDGWDSYNVDGLTVTNAWINIGDDCFSPKPNTSNIFVKNMYCNGTHGVSMGSIGQYPGVRDYIENAYIQNVTMLNGQVGILSFTQLFPAVTCSPSGNMHQRSQIDQIYADSYLQNGARLKGWAGPNVGYGYIRNVTFRDFVIGNTDWPIVLDACYFNVNASTCLAYPSRVDMVNISFANFIGSSSGKNGRKVASLTCSPAAVCSDIHLEDIDLTSPTGGSPIIICDGIQGSIGVDCVPSNSTLTK
ncbi:putative exopolygalacturonase B [Coleophoma crateriformis]|uniref:galacturonan 1,4-alpha-galacturonidase n=1 Tax=Coleophoma crateriformis TaxID=565419 RepID=A0A3D8QF17_9HELO|nr:putative exopolygalacturonase B [Coleophoma crateriformis]